MADALPKNRGYRTMPRQGMTRWSVVKDVDGHLVAVADFHGYPQARAESDRLNAALATEISVDSRVKVLA